MKSSKYERDGNYRNKFIQAHPPKNGKYRCVYCGRKIKTYQMEVDHVVAVNKAKTNIFYRPLVPRGVNDIRNLVPACHECNRKKSSKGGLWAIRGKYWKICLPIYYVIRALIIAAFVFIALVMIQYQPALDVANQITSQLPAL